MWRRDEENRRSDKARTGLRHSRARKRARRRLAGDTGSPPVARRIAWAVAEAWWFVQERLLWPAADLAAAAGEAVVWRLEDLVWAVRRRVAWPVRDRLESAGAGGAAGRRRALATGLAGVAAIALAAGLLAAAGEDSKPAVAEKAPEPEGPSLATVTEGQRPVIDGRTEEKPDGPVLSGSRPSFEPSPREEVERARKIIEAREAARSEDGDGETDAGPNEDGSGEDFGGEADEPEGEAEDGEPRPAESDSGGSESSAIEQEGLQPTQLEAEQVRQTPREEARRTAHRFARAFVAYELGNENPAIATAFEETAGARLAEELEARPPRLPRDGRVPRAEIVNVVAGPRQGRKIEVSVSLLRVRSLSELRLDLFRTGDGWRVATVRG